MIWFKTVKVLPIINYPLYGINHSLFKFFNDAFMNAITEIFNGVFSMASTTGAV